MVFRSPEKSGPIYRGVSIKLRLLGLKISPPTALPQPARNHRKLHNQTSIPSTDAYPGAPRYDNLGAEADEFLIFQRIYKNRVLDLDFSIHLFMVSKFFSV